MGFFFGNPFINDLAVRIRHLQLCALYFGFIRNGYLGKLNDFCLIFKGKQRRSRRSPFHSRRELKCLYLALGRKARSRCGFLHVVRKAHRQICRKRKRPFLIGGFFLDHGIRLHDHLSFRIGDIFLRAQGKYGSRNHMV